MKTRVIIILVIFILANSCTKDNSEKNDFRDKYVGKYKCLKLYHHLTESGNPGEIVFKTDTIGTQEEIEIKKNQNNTLSIDFNTLEYQAETELDSVFTCIECSGPPNTISFYNTNSVYIFDRIGTVSSYLFYGKKE